MGQERRPSETECVSGVSERKIYCSGRREQKDYNSFNLKQALQEPKKKVWIE